MKDYQSIVKELDANIPSDAVSSRKGGGNKTLSYLETWYVRNRLNTTLGQGNWGYSIRHQEVVDKFTTTNSYGKEVYTVHAIARVSLEVNIEGTRTSFEDVGYGNGSDPKGYGPAYELALKESASDAFKRAAINLGLSMGLALYDKTQEFVDEAEEAPKKVTKAAASAGGGSQLERISATSRVLLQKGLATRDDLLSFMEEKYNVNSKELLKPAQQVEFINHLEGLLSGKGA